MPQRGNGRGQSWGNANTDKGTLGVTHSLKRVGNRLMRDELKTEHSKRTQRMPAEVADALKAHRKDQAARQLRSAKWQDQDLVFPSDVGTPRQHSTVLAEFKRLTERAGLGRDWHLHETRHTWVTALSKSGVTTEEIADAAGHANSHVTQTVYRHNLADVVTVTSRWLYDPQDLAGVAQ